MMSRRLTDEHDSARMLTEVHVPLAAMVLGLDLAPRALSADEAASFGDPFTRNLLLKGVVPMTSAELAAAIDALPDGEARPLRKLYVVAEGAPFQSSHPDVPLNARLVVTWQKDAATAPDLLLSTTTELHQRDSLLQLIAWSETQGAFHFFERGAAGWAWAGHSFHALEPGSRGQGPFDSHVNGGLVMKELKTPWPHWHSQARGIPRELVFDTPEASSHPLFARLEGAEVLEQAVRTGVRRWTKRRVRSQLRDGSLYELAWYVRQVLWTTSVNIVSSEVLTRRLDMVDELALPRSFFFDEDGLIEAVSRLDENVDVTPTHELVVAGGAYLEAAAALGLRVEAGLEKESPVAAVAGDTEFAFAVPERAFEDQAVLSELMRVEALSPRLALCLLMVDFSNPVFSPDRAALLSHFPTRIATGDAGRALDEYVIGSARLADGSAAPERQLLALWDDADLLGTVARRLASFASAVQARLRTAAGIRDLLELADSRREAFRERALNEFRHTTARHGATVARLAMAEDGSLFTKTTDLGVKEN
jgi:hypothetical protein